MSTHMRVDACIKWSITKRHHERGSVLKEGGTDLRTGLGAHSERLHRWSIWHLYMVSDMIAMDINIINGVRSSGYVLSCRASQKKNNHWNHIYAAMNVVVYDSVNGLSPVRCQAITRISTVLIFKWALRINHEFWIKHAMFQKCVCKWHPQSGGHFVQKSISLYLHNMSVNASTSPGSGLFVEDFVWLTRKK